MATPIEHFAFSRLKSRSEPLTKEFFIGANGQLDVKPYPNVTLFNSRRERVTDIRELGEVIESISQDPRSMLIRGISDSGALSGTRRTGDLFREPGQGTRFVMLDLDDISLPEGMCSYSVEAIRYAITKLPEPFRNATCFYQFSSSAGIEETDGSLRKTGLSVHLFYWLALPMHGKTLSALIKKHCLDTGFYEMVEKRGATPMLKYGIDPATIRSAVQPHYTAKPILGQGVVCRLPEDQRQGFIEAQSEVVLLSAVPNDIVDLERRQKSAIITAWRNEHGFVARETMSKGSNGGVATATSYVQPGVPRQGRVFAGGRLEYDGSVFILSFEGENSPGSWYVQRTAPTLARRFGDGETVHLADLSQGAYEHVRDVLGWFEDIPSEYLSLQEDGFLPPFASFAAAKHSIVLAPTGSGKTFRTIEWMQAQPTGTLTIYATQTTSLGKEMVEHCLAAGLPTLHYQDFEGTLPSGGVLVTTNKSLSKFIGSATWGNQRFNLILDEIHIGLDDFMVSDGDAEKLDRAIRYANKALYLTGTLTGVQQQMLTTVIERAVGRCDEGRFGTYRFSPVKSNPLSLYTLDSLDSELIGLLENLRDTKAKGEPLPRTVIMLPLKKMGQYRLLLERYGLADLAHVVSRDENTQGEIDAARTSPLPVLVCSPLFATGINLAYPPEIFWTTFRYLDVDTSSIVQTINRANRVVGAPCEVRIFVGKVDFDPIYFPDTQGLQEELASYVDQEFESTLRLSSFTQMTRLVYNDMRKIEENTAKSFGALIANDGFQNYSLVSSELKRVVGKDRVKAAKEMRKIAHALYEQRIAEHVPSVNDPAMIFQMLENLRNAERSNYKDKEPLPQIEFDFQRTGRLMGLTGVKSSGVADRLSIHALAVIHGEKAPRISEPGILSRSIRDAYAEIGKKTQLLPELINVLAALASEQLSMTQFQRKLNQDKKLRPAFLVLAKSEDEYLSMSRQFERLAELREQCRSNDSTNNRRLADEAAQALAIKLLSMLGVDFEKEVVRGRLQNKYDAPIVPAWDFTEMIHNVERQALMLKSVAGMSLPPERLVHKLSLSSSEVRAETGVELKQCQRCRRLIGNGCVLGYRVDFSELGIEDVDFDQSVSTCADFHELPASFLAAAG